MNQKSVHKRMVVGFVLIALTAAACSSSSSDNVEAADDSEASTLAAQLDAIDAAIVEWETADNVADALVGAETAANLVVGPNGPDYGDRNGDGVVSGAAETGVLSGLDGTPVGLADAHADNQCVVDDVLGGSWDDPAARWQEMVTAIEEWQPGNNTMPSLAAHPMRIVGWASFSLATDSLDLIQEYAGHAVLHINISLRALTC